MPPVGCDSISSGGTPHDVHAAAIRLPARNARSEMFVGVGDAAIVLFFKIVFRQIGIRAAAQPELLDELFALFVGGQLQEGLPLFGRNNVDDVFVQPLFIRTVEFLQRLFQFFFCSLVSFWF